MVIIDEADCFIFNSPDDFMKLVKESACVCFTATPDNKDPSGVEARLLKAFGLTKYNYMIGDGEEEEKQKKYLAADIARDIQKEAAATNELKVAFIQKKAKEGPTIVYCAAELKAALIEKGSQVISVEPGQEIDTDFFRSLDKANEEGLYPLIVTCSTFGMRGIDYRSVSVPINLIISKSFDTERDALQGLNRVGRFGDSCTRTLFVDVPLTDLRASTMNKGKIQRFLAGVDKQKV